MKIYWLDDAKEQRINLIDFILENGGSVETAITVDESIGRHVTRLADHPKLGKRGTREQVNPDYGYLVVYKLGAKRVTIVSILRGRQVKAPLQ